MTRRILIIDDEDDIRLVAAMSLETVAGWDTVSASSGKQGIERAGSEQPVLLLTAKVQGSDQLKFAQMGVAAILFKPFDPLTLARQISAALGWKDSA